MKPAYNFVAILFLAVLTLTGCNSSDNSDTAVAADDRWVELGERQYLLALPQSFDENKIYPLIMAFHFSGGSATAMAQLTRLHKLSADYIVVYPQAQVEEWNEGCDCNKPARLKIDDVGFVDAILADMASRYKIDPDRVFATGYSQGGLFVQNLACKRSDVFRAVAVVSAPMSMQLASNCAPTNPISVLMIHAANDEVLPFNGLTHSNFGLIGSVEAAQLWAAHNQLQLDSEWQHLADDIRLRSSDGTDYKVTLYSPATGGHSWGFAGLNSSEEVLAFFAGH